LRIEAFGATLDDEVLVALPAGNGARIFRLSRHIEDVR
jgi:hypothetical protein